MALIKYLFTGLGLLIFTTHAGAQHHHETATTINSRNIAAQPLLAQALRVGEALSFIGSSLPTAAMNQLQALKQLPINENTVKRVQEILDPYCLAEVEISPEARVKVSRGNAKAVLMQEGWTSYLVKVHNQAGVNAVLAVESENALAPYKGSTNAPRMRPENKLTPGQLDNRFMNISMYRGRPLQERLSGLELEYGVIQLHTTSKGKKEVELGFNVGTGSQDIGFRNSIAILFNIRPSVKMIFNVKDHDNKNAMASFIITDGVERSRRTEPRDMHYPWHDWEQDNPRAKPDSNGPNMKLRGIYPLPSARLASRDPFPDYFFQPQIYRTSGEYVYLPPGTYDITYSRGPEYLEQHKQVTIPAGKDSVVVDFNLKRWVNMAARGWYSADHHIHAAGCAHYESPEEGVKPLDMFRQVQGEDLNIGSNLTWGPSWYHQKQYFTGKDDKLSDAKNLLRYDIEVSGFPSSHAGHVVLLNLKEDDYPNTKVIEDWPSFTLPVLQWARKQGGVAAYAHSGWGLEPLVHTTQLPNYVIPKMDGIGANEYIVTVTHNAVDYYSIGDTPSTWELNMWYHTLNCGFKVPIGGETDFPCISDEKVGQARTYAKLKGGLQFAGLMDAIKRGDTYISDGMSHLVDFSISAAGSRTDGNTIAIANGGKLQIKAKAVAMLPEKQDERGRFINSREIIYFPYWHLERARIGQSRNIDVELIHNGAPVAKKTMPADGKWQDVQFDYDVRKSGWFAVRINYSSHSNPIFVEVAGKPVREKKSIEWCRAVVDQCWKNKRPNIRKSELADAEKAYDHARAAYDLMIRDAEQ